MESIQTLKQLNITFRGMDDDAARKVMEREYPLADLLEYGALFDRYRGTEKKGRFVALDFAQLYALARLDETFRCIVVRQCLEIEQAAKTILLARLTALNMDTEVLRGYIASDRPFLESAYTAEKSDVMADRLASAELEELTLPQFLRVVRFGTMVHFWTYLSSEYPAVFPELQGAAFLNHLIAVRRLRNRTAHNIPLLSLLAEKCENGSHDVSIFLSQNGMKNRTLHANMTRLLTNEYMSLLCVYQKLVVDRKRAACYEDLRRFLERDCLAEREWFRKNELLVSAHTFLCRVIEIYSGE